MLFNVHYLHSIYFVYLQNISHRSIFTKFDTGAVNTVISLSALVGNNDVQFYKEKLEEHLKSKSKSQLKKICKTFKSASDNEMHGILCCSKNANISGYIMPEFYYYLLLDSTSNLLGDDFISCCEFSHKPNCDIEITRFNHTLYSTKFNKSYLNEDELCEILELQ